MSLLTITVLAPFVGFLLLAILRDGRLNETSAGIIGTLSILISAISGLMYALDFNGMPQIVTLWTWFSVENLTSNVAFYYDGLALTMVSIITGVGLLIHLFSTWYMKGEEGFARFFSYMNLFIGFMLILVLADNYLLLYLGWEGVGLCSYLLIGFYYKERKNSSAAMKAFIVTRVGDVFLAIGLFILFYQVGSLNIQEVSVKSSELFVTGSKVSCIIAVMFMLGAFGKSAQLPLQTWLADAMAGPTPISALIHAATMVTAGVYLIARSHVLFELAPDVLYLVGIVGAITLLMAGFVALKQYDIKKILAYSTMSQLGYMFLALGIGAYDASIRHLMVHAFFKALLFLGAGAVIIATHHEQDIRKMGGLYKRIPFVYVCFLIGSAALVALPWVSAGFYTKDDILWQVWASGHHSLFCVGLLGAALTSMYTLRLFYVAFHGKSHGHCNKISGWNYRIPLAILAVLSTYVGGQIYPPLTQVFSEFPFATANVHDKHWVEIATIGVVMCMLLMTFLWYSRKDRVEQMLDKSNSLFGRLFASAFGFDCLYNMVFVKPYFAIAHCLRSDPISQIVNSLSVVFFKLANLNSQWQNGKIRTYATSFAFGMILVMLIIILARG